MKSHRYRPWRPIAGVLAVGLIAFGFGLKGAPAGDDDRPEAASTVNVKEAPDTPFLATARIPGATVRPDEDVNPMADLAGDGIGLAGRGDVDIRWAREISVVAVAGVAQRGSDDCVPGGVANGETCVCDCDCEPTAGRENCKSYKCVWDGPLGNGVCQDIPAEEGTPCDTDSDYCGGYELCDAFGECQAELEPANPCAGRCEGANDLCDRDYFCDEAIDCDTACILAGGVCNGASDNAGAHCDETADCPSGDCDLSNQVVCVDDGGGVGHCTVGVTPLGRCCLDGEDYGSIVTEAACTGAWIEVTNPDAAAQTIVCPKYSSGIVDDSQAQKNVGPIRQTEQRCAIGGGLCLDNRDCVSTCSGGDNANKFCFSDAECAAGGGTCNFGNNTCEDEPAACHDGYVSIGDDYSFLNGSYLKLEQIRYIGGPRNAGETVIIEFWDTDMKRVGIVGLVTTQRIRQFGPSGAGLHTILVDCSPNCRDDCNIDAARRQDAEDPPLIIPPNGYITMRTTRNPDNLDGGQPGDGPPYRAGSLTWQTTADHPGSTINNPNVILVNGVITTPESIGLAAGQGVFAFELIGEKVCDPTGTCCDPETGDCTDVDVWACGVCVGQAEYNDDACSENRECGQRGSCSNINWFGPFTKCDIRTGCLTGCQLDVVADTCSDCSATPNCTTANPCTEGACCTDGVCTIEDDATGCGLVGGAWQGFGTACDPNCCTQTEELGGECCADRYACVSGGNDGDICDIDNGNGDCADGGTCTRVCVGAVVRDVHILPDPDTGGECVCLDENGDIIACTVGGVHGDACFPEAGGGPCDKQCETSPVFLTITGDSTGAVTATGNIDDCAADNVGWYEVFHIDKCALTTLDLCCNEPRMFPFFRWIVGPYVEPQTCPCGGVIGNTNFALPGTFGLGQTCLDGNWSGDFILRAGTYFYSPWAGPVCEGTFTDCTESTSCDDGVPCVDKRGPYSMQLTFRNCPTAACCCQSDAGGPNSANSCYGNAGLGGLRLTQYQCEEEIPANGSTSDGAFGVCDSSASLDGTICRPPADAACVADGGTCILPDYCDWLGIGDQVTAGCGGSPCDTGACCLGAFCDQSDQSNTLASCETQSGLFHGGAKCADEPCAVCTFEDAAHCQTDSDGFIFGSDRETGSRRIDDFIGGPGGIARVCAWVCYTADGQECSDDPPDDAWHIRIWDTVNGLPGNELAYYVVNEPDSSSPVQPGQTRCWRATWPLDPPLTEGQDYDEGDCLWLELTGYGEGSQCRVFWQESHEGNDSSIEDRYSPLASPTDHTPTTGMEYTDFQNQDTAFCIDSGIAPATVPGVSFDGGCGDVQSACCYPDFGTGQIECVDSAADTISTCQGRGGLWFPTMDCAFVTGLGGCPVPVNDLCENAINLNDVGGICDQVGDGTQEQNPDLMRCDGAGADGDKDEGCFAIGEACRTLGDRCRPWADEGYYCEVDVNNVLATTDGDPGGGSPPDDPTQACNSGANAMQADIWYRYTAPCTGLLSIRACDDPNFDMMLGVYQWDPADCPPTDNTNLLACDDDYCPGAATSSGVALDVTDQQQLLIRVAGWSAAGGSGDAGQGKSTLEMSVFCDPIVAANAPLPADGTAGRCARCGRDDLCVDAGVCVGGSNEDEICTVDDECCVDGCDGGEDDGVCFYCTHDVSNCIDGLCYDPKNRYISFDPNNGTTLVAFEVTLSDGRTCWVDEPCVVTDTNGVDPQWVAGCVQSAAGDGTDMTRDWSAFTDPANPSNAVVHVRGCVILPDEEYELQTLGPNGALVPGPLVLGTVPHPNPNVGSWADIVGDFAGGVWTAPNGNTNFKDVAAGIQGFQQLTTAAPVTWVDLVDTGGTEVPNYKINFNDIGAIIRGFLNTPYPGDVSDCLTIPEAILLCP